MLGTIIMKNTAIRRIGVNMTYQEAKVILREEMLRRDMTMRELADEIMGNEQYYLENDESVLQAFDLYVNSL